VDLWRVWRRRQRLPGLLRCGRCVLSCWRGYMVFGMWFRLRRLLKQPLLHAHAAVAATASSSDAAVAVARPLATALPIAIPSTLSIAAASDGHAFANDPSPATTIAAPAIPTTVASAPIVRGFAAAAARVSQRRRRLLVGLQPARWAMPAILRRRWRLLPQGNGLGSRRVRTWLSWLRQQALLHAHAGPAAAVAVAASPTTSGGIAAAPAAWYIGSLR